VYRPGHEGKKGEEARKKKRKTQENAKKEGADEYTNK
jgi:hypothetical protein